MSFIHKELENTAKANNIDIITQEFAIFLDKTDELHNFRQQFYYPRYRDLPNIDLSSIDNPDADCIYFCGNSLGLQPKRTRELLAEQLDFWAKYGVIGHTIGSMPWESCDEYVNEDCAKLIGASKSEVAIMNSLTVNMHLMLCTFYKPTAERYKILIEGKAFPSDHYVCESQIKWHNLDPKDCLICAIPRNDEDCLRTEDILDLIEKEGNTIALISFSAVHYYTGQFFDMPAITKAGKAKGCIVGWNLAHAIGNVEMNLHDWNVDFACWCTYKYLCTGAGGIAGNFVHDKHFGNIKPALQGWWGQKRATRFIMDNKMDLCEDVAAFRVSNPSIMLCASLRASLDIFNNAGLPRLRQKSKYLTGYLEYLLIKFFSKTNTKYTVFIEIMTPADPNQRGCQLSLRFSESASKVHAILTKQGVVCDLRLPDVVRIAPCAMYNTFTDVYTFICKLQTIFSTDN